MVAVILFLFLLNARTTLISLTAIPVSLLVTALVFKYFGLTINTMTLGGLAIAIGFGCNLSRLWPTYEYGQETIRGKSELSAKSSKGDGLDKDYLFGWSYGVGESLTLLVPHFAGGGGCELGLAAEEVDVVHSAASTLMPCEARASIHCLSRSHHHECPDDPHNCSFFGAFTTLAASLSVGFSAARRRANACNVWPLRCRPRVVWWPRVCRWPNSRGG